MNGQDTRSDRPTPFGHCGRRRSRTGVRPAGLPACLAACWFRRTTPAALADALSSLARDPDRRCAMGERGRERVQREFHIARSMAASEQTYCPLVAIAEPVQAQGH